jgi:Fe-S-cluster-containing dehydrogenase component
MVVRQGQMTLSRTLEEGKSNAGHRPGLDRLRTVAAISRLPVPASNDADGLGGMGFASLFVSKACTACAACARACPTGALKIIKNADETAFNLTFSVRNCIGCDICTHVCNWAAINVNHAPTYAQVFSQPTLVLQAGGLVKCEQCGILMAAQPELHLCQLCERQMSRQKKSTGRWSSLKDIPGEGEMTLS